MVFPWMNFFFLKLNVVREVRAFLGYYLLFVSEARALLGYYLLFVSEVFSWDPGGRIDVPD
jgi:hypothetical protein